jgi:hypothetical protein
MRKKYNVEKIDTKLYEEVPCMYRIDSPKRCELAKDMIEALMRKHHIEKGEPRKEKIRFLTYDQETLIKKGWVKKTRVRVE